MSLTAWDGIMDVGSSSHKVRVLVLMLVGIDAVNSFVCHARTVGVPTPPTSLSP